ncbi:class I SAM-dependent methyltransferase [Desulfurella sp.]|uniref:class I SAM-dependent methyltransferase n=1 Tax=Desulfurella sp. TaxID=1962857 RepID=UPI003D105C4B
MDNKDIIISQFGDKAQNYKLSPVHSNKDYLERMIEILKPDVKSVALDIATGAGHTAIALSKYVEKVIAIDITPQMLKQAHEMSESLNINNIDFEIGDVHSLKYEDHSFDIVACRYAAHHFYNIKKALNELYRVLKPNGKLYILDCSVYNLRECQEKINKIELLRDNSHVCSYSLDQWEQMLGDLNLTIQYGNVLESEYILPQWFDRMVTPEQNRNEIFNILFSLSNECRKYYNYDHSFITTYYVEIFAIK